MRAKPKAVLLDWDDTLVDSRTYYENCSNQAIDILVEKHGYTRPSKLYSERPHGQKAAEYFLQEFGERGARLVEEIREEILMNGNAQPPSLKPGAREILKFIALNGIPHSIVSDTPQSRLENNVERTLSQAGLKIPTLVGTEKGTPKKPHPAGIYRALQVLSLKYGQEIDASNNVLMIGDQPLKDGRAAKNAGISHAIVPHEKSTNTDGWNIYQDLNTITQELARTVGQEFRRPRFTVRDSYNGVPLKETEIITGSKNFIESPLTNDIADPNVFSSEERELHNLRWIAKRAKTLDLTGDYSRDEQMEAAYQVVQRLLTPDMLDSLTQRTLDAVQKERNAGYDPEKEIVVHLPHRLVNPPKAIENMLSVAYNHELANILNKIFNEKHPELNVRFDSNDRLLTGLSLQKYEEIETGDNHVKVVGLSGHNPKNTAQAGRSTGTLLDRIVKQPIFDYSTFVAGDLVIITDDHVQGGGTFITWYHALKQKGVVPVAFTSLSAMPESINMQPHPELRSDMNQAMGFAVNHYLTEHPHADQVRIGNQFTNAIDNMLGKVGISVDTLSNREALTVMSYIIDGTNPAQMEWFGKIAEKYGADLGIVERKDESVMIQAMQKPVTPKKLLEEVEKMIPKYTVGRSL